MRYGGGIERVRHSGGSGAYLNAGGCWSHHGGSARNDDQRAFAVRGARSGFTDRGFTGRGRKANRDN